MRRRTSLSSTPRQETTLSELALLSILGLVLDLPTVGVTDRALIAKSDEPAATRGVIAPLLIEGELVGYRLRTQAGVRALFVHAACRTLPEIACGAVLAIGGGCRTPNGSEKLDNWPGS
jgi:deoxyribonuclease V